jgi:hypothetical protein
LGLVGQFKCVESAISAISPLLLCWIAGPSLIGVVLLRRCGDKRDDLLPTRYVLVNVPFVIRRPCPLAGDSLGLVSGGVVFLGLSKLLNQEDALGAPCLDTVILALHSRVLVGRPRLAGTGGVLRTGFIRHFDVTLRFATPDIRPASTDAFAVVGGGCTGRAHGCKAKQGRRGKDGADVWLLVPQ